MTSSSSPPPSGTRSDFAEPKPHGVGAPDASGGAALDPLTVDDVLHVMDGVLWRFWPDGRRRLHYGPAFERIWGLTEAMVEAGGIRFLDTVHPDDRLRMASLCDASHRGQEISEEFRVQQPSGDVRWVSYRTFPVRDASGVLTHTLAVATEVTERRRVLAALEQRNNELVTTRNRLVRLLRAMATVHEAADEQDVIQRVAGAVHDSGWGRVAVSLLDESWGVLGQAFRGLSDAEIAEVRRNRPSAAQRERMFGPECERFRVSRSYFIPGDELERQRESWRFLLSSTRAVPAMEWDPRNLLYIPLTGHRGRVIGYISMDDPEVGDRELSDAFRYLESLAELAAAVIESLRLRRDEKRRDDEMRFLMRELDHRVRNTLAAIGNLAVMSSAHTDSVREFLPSFLHRIEAFASIHSMLVRNPAQGDIPLEELIQSSIEPFQERDRMRLSGSSCRVPARTCRPVCMTLNELATNAAKYGALSDTAGHVEIAWSFSGTAEAPGRVTVCWREWGGPPVTPPTKEGIGTRIISGSIPHELNGEVECRYEPAGAVCEMRFDCDVLL